MKVFISWSGAESRDVALALRNWLPRVLQTVEPWVSAEDIDAGKRWSAEIADELEQTDFGLVCVTRANTRSEWLHFEAGALAKSVGASRVVPLAIDLTPGDIADPLGQFQATGLNGEGMTRIVRSINAVNPVRVSSDIVAGGIEKWWGDLEDELAEIADKYVADDTPTEDEQGDAHLRSDRDLLEEILSLQRRAGVARVPASTPRRPHMTPSAAALFYADALEADGFTGWQISSSGSSVEVELPRGSGPPPEGGEVVRASQRLSKEHGIGTVFSEYDPPDEDDTAIDWSE